MAYNYSPWLLTVNADVVEKLVRLADDHGQFKVAYESPDEARLFRHKISELLACLARNRPNLAYVRRDVRTWITYDGKYNVNVGVPKPSQRIRGYRPQPIVIGATESQLGGLLITEEITAENWQPIALKLAAAKISDIQMVTFERPPEQAGVDYIANALAPEFEVKQREPQLVLQRVSRT